MKKSVPNSAGADHPLFHFYKGIFELFLGSRNSTESLRGSYSISQLKVRIAHETEKNETLV
jgi:hypothetical protein